MGRPPRPTSRTPGIGAQTGSNFVLNTVLNISGFLPAFAHTQLQQDTGNVFVLRGRNFDWDLQGPKSGYGNQRITSDALPMSLIDSSCKWFRVQERTLLFTAGKVFSCTAACTPFVEVFAFPWGDRGCMSCDRFHAWSMAYVGQVYLFSHPYAGIIFYDELKDEWGVHPMDVPCFDSCVYGICRARNRLIILTKDTLVYSGYDKPFELSCLGYASAGIQSLDEISKGTPYGVYETKAGFVAYTSRGALVGRELDQVHNQLQRTADPGQQSAGEAFITLPAFRVDIEMTDCVPLSSHCIVEVSGQVHLILTKRGFYMVDGSRGHNELTQDQSWQTIIGSYIADRELTLADSGECARLRLEYDWQHGKLYVGFRDVPTRPYSRTLVYQFAYDKWGSFDFEYWCLGATHFDRQEFNRGKRYGWLTALGYVVEIDHGSVSHATDTATIDRVVGDRCHPYNYALDSYIEVGPFRRTDFMWHDRMTSFVNVTLTCPPARGDAGMRSPATNAQFDAWEERAALEPPAQFEAEIGCSIDASRLFEDNREPLHLVEVDGRSRHYSCYNTGVCATIILRAARVSDYFQLHTIHVSAHNAGRY